MDVFAIAFDVVIGIERGVTTDRGGLTKYGISKRQYPDLDIANLTLDQARRIYETDYWNKCRCDSLPARLAVCVFDAAVNEGQGTAIRMLQRAVKVLDDGMIGPSTIAAAHSVSDALTRFLAERAFMYAHTLDFETEGHGWMSRLFIIHEKVLAQ